MKDFTKSKRLFEIIQTVGDFPSSATRSAFKAILSGNEFQATAGRAAEEAVGLWLGLTELLDFQEDAGA